MLLNTKRAPTCVGICDFNVLNLRDHNKIINTKNYLSSKSPQPTSYRDLRLVVTNRVPSNIVILSKASPFLTTTNASLLPRRKTENNKKGYKQNSFDVYRSLPRSISHCSISSEREISNDETNVFANSFTIDRIALLPNTGLFHQNNLSKVQKQNTHSNGQSRSYSRAGTVYDSSPSSRCEYIDSTRSTSLEKIHPIIPTMVYAEANSDQTNTTTIITASPAVEVLSSTPKSRTRKQLHVYIPQISC